MNIPRFVHEFYSYNKKRVSETYLPSAERDIAVQQAAKLVRLCENGLIAPNEAVWKMGEVFGLWE